MCNWKEQRRGTERSETNWISREAKQTPITRHEKRDSERKQGQETNARETKEEQQEAVKFSSRRFPSPERMHTWANYISRAPPLPPSHPPSLSPFLPFVDRSFPDTLHCFFPPLLLLLICRPSKLTYNYLSLSVMNVLPSNPIFFHYRYRLKFCKDYATLIYFYRPTVLYNSSSFIHVYF